MLVTAPGIARIAGKPGARRKFLLDARPNSVDPAWLWRSWQPVPDAFKQASGRDLDDWVRNWARQMYGSIDMTPAVPFAGIAPRTLVLLSRSAARFLSREGVASRSLSRGAG
jgi:hypothetical protein